MKKTKKICFLFTPTAKVKIKIVIPEQIAVRDLRKQLFVTGGYKSKLNTSLGQQWSPNESV